jgi:hypothetical protein
MRDNRASITKQDAEDGDFMGHEFHGNQHVGGGGRDRGHKASLAAHQATKNASGREGHSTAASLHERAAILAHKKGREKAAAYHEKMYRYHTSRANRFKGSL